MTGNKLFAAQSAGYDNCTHINRFLKNDPEFAQAFKEAEDAAGDAAVAEVIRRGKDGVLKAKYHQGEVVGYEVEYSDTLLLAYVKSLRPEFNEKTQKEIKHTGIVGVALLPTTFISVEEWEKQAAQVHAGQQPLQIAPPAIDAEFEDVNAAEDAEKELADQLADL